MSNNASEKWRYCGPIQSVQTEKTLDIQGIPQAESFNQLGVAVFFILWTIGCAFMLYAWIHLALLFPKTEKRSFYRQDVKTSFDYRGAGGYLFAGIVFPKQRSV